MDSDDENNEIAARSKHYNALRVELVAALSAFDRAQDWADLIHDLQRVNRVLNKHQNSTFLPEKKLLAKRLAQCLTSSLPSGVHLKALETYRLVFGRIGNAKLAKDLPLYAAGLFPVFSYCATSLKPTLLTLYENHFLPLGRSLAPVIDGFVLAVLPGLEDESSEWYGRSFRLLSSLCKAIGDVGIFSRGLWRALLLAPEMRLSAAHYLRCRLAEGDSELREEMVSDMPLVSYAIAKALSDKKALVQRGVLDLLLGELALNSPFFVTKSTEHYDAAVSLVGGVFGALLRRDISLTKRVHSWLLGGKDGVSGVAHCKEHSHDFILAAVDNEIRTATSNKERLSAASLTRPYKVVSALLDRDEILDCVGDEVALRILSYGQETLKPEYDEYVREIRHAFSEVVQQLGVATILTELEKLLAKDDTSTKPDFQLFIFALTALPMDDEVVRKRHLPALLSAAVQSLESSKIQDGGGMDKAVFFCGKALSLVSLHYKRQRIPPELLSAVEESIKSFAAFFMAWLAQSIVAAPLALRQDFNQVSPSSEVTAEAEMAASQVEDIELVNVAKEGCTFLMVASLSVFWGLEIVNASLQAAAKCSAAMDVRISLAGAQAYAAVAGQWLSLATSLRSFEFVEQTMGVIRRAWRQLHPSLQTATPQSVQVFLLLQRQFPEHVKAVVADGMLSPEPARRLRNLERFACLWNHAIEHHLMPRPASDGLFLMLDALIDDEWGPKMLARSWLADALGANAGAVLDAPLSMLLTPEARTVGPGHCFAGVYDAPRALYGFQVLSSILESCSGRSLGVQMSSLDTGPTIEAPTGKHGRTGIWALASTPPSVQINSAIRTTLGPPSQAAADAVAQSEAVDTVEGTVQLWPVLPVPNYILTIAVTALSYLRGKVPPKFDGNEEDVANKGSQSSGMIQSLFEGDSFESDFYSSGKTDNVIWMLAGLGFRPLSALHATVSGAAAECLARLLAVMPTPTRASATVAHHLAEPILSLLTSQTERLNPVLQLHYIDVVESLILCDGPAYRIANLSSENSDPHNSLIPTLATAKSNGLRRDSRSHRRLSVSSVEGQTRFLPWLFEEMARVCSPANHGEAIGSQEVLGLRQRWIRFVSTLVSHVGVSLPAASEGLLVLLVDLLGTSNKKSRKNTTGFRDIDFSRLDDRVILLKTVAVIFSNVLWSFELALSADDLGHEAQGIVAGESENHASVHFASGNSTPTRHSPVASRRADSGSDGNVGFDGSFRSASSFSRDGEQPDSRLGAAALGAADMINAMNPLRMLDFVKDVFSGASNFGTQRIVDPRRAAARILFWYLGNIMSGVAEVWGPDSNASSSGGRTGRDQLVSRGSSILSPVRESNSPRLSKDLPRERRHAQRMAVLSIIEPIFKLRPIDVIASVIAQFVPKYDNDGAIYEHAVTNSHPLLAVKILHAVESSAPDTVVNSVSVILELAMKWDAKSLASVDGKENTKVRETARMSVMSLINNDQQTEQPVDLAAAGQVSSAAVAGGAEGVISEGVGTQYAVNTYARKEMFCAGDYFAQFSPGDVEIACFRFLSAYFDASIAGNEVHVVWPMFFELVRDIVGASTRKATPVAALVAIASFASKSPAPITDKRESKEMQQAASSTVAACSIVAAGSMDLSNEPQVSSAKETKSRLSVYALKGMALAIPSLVNSAFLHDRPHLSNLVTSALAPSVSTLKRTSARAAAIRIAALDKPSRTPSTPPPDQHADDKRDHLAAVASADLMLQVCRHDWGVRHARRELVALLDDPNFFHGKSGGLMPEMTNIVREVIAGGGAASLLTSIGTHSVTVSGGIPVIFSGRDSEAVLRARAMRRIAFCVFVGDSDHYISQLPYVLERLRDAMRMGDSNLVVECLLCLRVLLLKNGPSSISAFRATTLSEIFRITSNPSENILATIAALQFLDLTTLLSPPDNAYERCFFFAEEGAKWEADTTDYRPLVSNLARNSSSSSAIHNDLRLKAGLTVYDGRPMNFPDITFVTNYAAALSKRNASPDLATGEPQLNVIMKELGQEFVE